MRLKAYMANVTYSKSIENNVLPEILRKKVVGRFSHIKTVNVLPEEDYEDNTLLGDEPEDYWIIKTHYMGKGTKSKRAIYQIAFKPILEKNEKIDDFYLRVRPGKDSETIDYLRYCYKSNLFFYSEPKKSRKEKDSSIVNTAGRFLVEVVDLKSNNILKSINVLVNSSSLSHDDYLKMIRDLREIREDIIINNNSKVSVGKRYINKRKNIEEVVNELEIALNTISKKPKTKLKSEYIKKKYNQINKITNKTLIEKSIYPYKNSFTAISYEESLDIYEHRLLKQVLINLKEKIKEYKEFYNDYIEAEKRDLYDARNRFESITKKSCIEILTYKRKIENYINYVSQNEVVNNKLYNSEVYLVKKNEIDKKNIIIYFDKNINKFVLNINYVARSIICGECVSSLKKIESMNKYLNLSLRTNNINEMLFLVESIEKANTHLKLNINMNFSSYVNKYKNTFNLDVDSISKINEVEVKRYNSKEKYEFLKKYFTHRENEEAYEIIESLNKKGRDIKILMTSFQDNNSWETLESKIDKLLGLNVFNNVKTNEINSIKPTQIFINDNSYRKAYKAIKNCNNKISILSMKGAESILVKATCDIYEIWCAFKIAQLLIIKQRWTLLNNEEVLKELDNFLKVKDSYKEKKVEFKFTKLINDKRKVDLSLIYEGRVYYDGDKYKTPDYQFIYEVKNENNEVINTMRVYLDAKYRDYFSQGSEVYNKDINEVAIEKYIETFENTENRAKCSMIVHSYKNDRFVNWGADCHEREKLSEKIKLSPHGYGAFYLVPSDTSNLSKFLRLLPEYHLNFRDNFNIEDEFNGYDVCWECGETKDIEKEVKYTKSSFEKYYYTCKKCNEFWVKNHCEATPSHKLIKHRNNYHLLNNNKNNPWHLICPDCGNGLE